ncbi:MAG: rod shape-determining protein RodA [Actinobacteria bacterium]|nr:MAG: rod shape-determining protein RodA [Actinomycetota bacterium]
MAFEGSLGRLERIGRERVGGRALAERSPIRHLDPTLLLSALGLTAFGNLMVYSASSARLRAQGTSPQYLLNRQMTFSLIGIGVMVVVAMFNYRRLRAWTFPLYFAGLALLIAVLSPLGASAKGAQRWINVGFFQLQPSEFMKLAVLVALAYFLSERRGHPAAGAVVGACALVLVPAVLIFKQPDLGTLLVLMALLLTLLVVGGTRARIMLVIILLGVSSVVGVLHTHVLKQYQLARLTAFLDPSTDQQRTGYNLDQARIAVGSGQITGKGLFTGTQTNLDFVPEVQTDFIFTAVGEELGFVGSAVLLGLFAIFLWRGLRIAMLSKDLFGTLLAAGVVAMLAFQMFINIGMTIGVSPITGIPLPFVSYGGSSMITTYIATGLLLNVHMRRLSS